MNMRIVIKKMTPSFIIKIFRFFHFGKRKFTDYKNFLEKAQKSGFVFVPLKELANSKIQHEKVIGIRHDVDNDLDHAFKIAKIEHDLGIKSTYLILHTSKFFFKDISKGKINESLIKKLQFLQNSLGHEIGIHMDLMPIEIIYKKNPFEYLKNLIDLLRSNEINIKGVSPHGNLFKNIYKSKFYDPNKKILNNNIFANPYIEFNVKMFNLDYEAYSLEFENYFSDAKFIANKRWDFSNVQDSFFLKKGTTIILIHTIHWAESKFNYFTFNLMLTVIYFYSYIVEFIKYKRFN